MLAEKKDQLKLVWHSNRRFCDYYNGHQENQPITGGQNQG